MKRFAAVLLAGVLSFASVIPSFGAVTTNGDFWAVPSLEFAYEEGIMTEAELQKAKSPISRLEFCKIVMRFLHAVTGKTYVAAQASPFQDCIDPDVIAAYEAGIISGVDVGIFAPERTLTREQMAIMLARTLKLCGIDLAEQTAENPFSDTNVLYESSRQYITQLFTIDIISGYDDNTYGPFRQMTMQECAVGFVKAYQYAVEHLPKAEPSAPEAVLNPEASKTVSLAEKKISLGMTTEELIHALGEPDRIDETVYTLDRYVYLDAYEDYFFVTFHHNELVEFFTPTKNFSYLDTDGHGTAADIKHMSHISASEHSAVIQTELAEAKFLLDYEGNIQGFLLQSPAFLNDKMNLRSNSVSLTDSLEAELADFIQVKRNAAGLDFLILDRKLYTSAKKHSKDMASNLYFSYTNKLGDSPFHRILNEGKNFFTASEVISKKRVDTIHIYQDWIRTTAKIHTLLDNNMDEMGVGVATRSGELYVTVDLCGHIEDL